MGLERTILPEGYRSRLDIRETELGIKLIKDTLERKLAEKLHLIRVSAPLFVRPESGLNDDLNGIERPVRFAVSDADSTVEVVHSLAKWKRLALCRYRFENGMGLYTDMNAIRRDETLDNLHSIYVDQWDWERELFAEERTATTLKRTVERIWEAITETEAAVCRAFSVLRPFLPERIRFFTTQEARDRYPTLTPKEREDALCREYGAVFLMEIGDVLSDGTKHDGRAPDYDDWHLNGDILVWYPVLGHAVELSSMGIRVDAATLTRQLEQANCTERAALDFHQRLLRGELPQTMGGGIGQSRVCMLLLQKAHIGEVQASVWPQEMQNACEEAGVLLL